METTTDKKTLDPQTNVLHVSNKKDVRFFMFLSKVFLTKFEECELHGLGEAMSICVRVAENLQRFGYVEITSIQTFSFSPDDEKEKEKEKSNEEEQKRKKVKMIIKIKRTPEFFGKVGDIKK